VKAVVSVSGSLLDALQVLVPGASKRTLRQMLEQGRITVDGQVCVVASRQIASGAVLEIGVRRTPIKLPNGLNILFEDDDIIVIRKPPGLLTVATIDEKDQTVYAYLRTYLKERHPRHKLFIVHRLDKFASGVLVFAKSEKVQSILQGIFSRHEIQRKYWAIVEGTVEKNHGTIQSYLAQDRAFRMHSTDNETEGKAAVTHFCVLRRVQNFSVLEVTLETGRKNQIRAHLSEIGHPIVGDRAYGSTRDPLKRLGLHAFQLGFNHPTHGKAMLFQTEPPPEFLRYLPAAVRVP
jgi:23S rRNA pseudouridine1911/1915/1917 synthase